MTPIWGVVPCGGSGSRAGSGLPKQYRPLAGQTVLAHTLQSLAQVPGLGRVVVAVAPDLPQQPALWALAQTAVDQASAGGRVPMALVPCAGPSRAETVEHGLLQLRLLGAAERDWVLVHDAARCLVTPGQVRALIDACLEDAVGGLLALPLPDTLKQARQGRVSATLPRADKWLAQTPQMFRLGGLLQALQQARMAGREITDEASAMEQQGLQPRLVPGSAQNFKLTYPDDFVLAQAVLQARQATTPDGWDHGS